VAKSSAAEHVRRVNATIQLLDHRIPAPQVVTELVSRYGLSRRQAYRYLAQAQQADCSLAVPAEKTVFTVKLPRQVVTQVRQQAKRRQISISVWVEQALRKTLDEPQVHGSI
jgi:hypothetical protein